jgi:hypothetical protein
MRWRVKHTNFKVQFRHHFIDKNNKIIMHERKKDKIV